MNFRQINFLFNNNNRSLLLLFLALQLSSIKGQNSSIIKLDNELVGLEKAIKENKVTALEKLDEISNNNANLEDSISSYFAPKLLYIVSDYYDKEFTKSKANEWLIQSTKSNKILTAKKVSLFMVNLLFENLDYDSALYYVDYTDSLLNLYEDYDEWGELYLIEGAIHNAKGDYIESIESVFNAVDKFQQGDINKKQLAFSYLQIGSTYMFINFIDKADRYYRLAENHFDELNDTLGAAITRSNRALLEIQRKEYTKALVLLKGSLEEILKSERFTTISYAYQSIAESFLNLEELDSAQYYVSKSNKLNKELDFKIGLGMDCYLKSKICQKRSHRDSTLYFGSMAFDILKEEEDYELLSELTLLLAREYALNNQSKKSLFFYEENIKNTSLLRESNFSINKIVQEENANLEKAKYELKLLKEKKRLQEYENERKQEQFIRAAITAGIAILLLLLSLYFLYRIKKLNKELKKQKALLTKELELKRSLLGEIHHRVKNNLQIISSMLSIQSQYIHDERLDVIIRECRNRIVSMSLIHESLYRREIENRSIFSQYIKELIPQLIDTYQIDQSKIKLDLNIDEFELSLDDSVPCGLLINEIISNSMKHAFKGINSGYINLSMTNDKNYIQLLISDNGVGLKKINPEEHDSFGFLLINSLVNQLGAKKEINNKDGLSYSIRWRSHSDKLLN